MLRISLLCHDVRFTRCLVELKAEAVQFAWPHNGCLAVTQDHTTFNLHQTCNLFLQFLYY